MCRAIKELIEDGRLEGFAVGFERGQTAGYERGQTVGFERGQIHILSKLVHENVINLSEAAKQMGMTENEFVKTMKGSAIEQIMC